MIMIMSTPPFIPSGPLPSFRSFIHDKEEKPVMEIRAASSLRNVEENSAPTDAESDQRDGGGLQTSETPAG
jgi:hypothetical protein